MTRLVFCTDPENATADAVVLTPAPPEAQSVSARIAYGLEFGEGLRGRSWPASLAQIELQGAGLDQIVAIGVALQSIPLEGASVDVQWSEQGRADADTPFGREVVAKFVAQLKARGVMSVSC